MNKLLLYCLLCGPPGSMISMCIGLTLSMFFVLGSCVKSTCLGLMLSMFFAFGSCKGPVVLAELHFTAGTCIHLHLRTRVYRTQGLPG